jgi:hypothetical protein
VLTLRNAAGTVVASNADDPQNVQGAAIDPILFFSIVNGGNFTIAVSGSDTGRAGYELLLELVTPVAETEPNNTAATATATNLGLDSGEQNHVVVRGEIPAATTDVDFYTIVLGVGDVLFAVIKSGRNGGSWNGTGVKTSSITSITGLALARNFNGSSALMSTFSQNEAVGVNDVLVKFSYNGDADLSGVVDATDYGYIDRGFLSRQDSDPNNDLLYYQNGDFNYDGSINISDYFLIDSAYSMQGDPL